MPKCYLKLLKNSTVMPYLFYGCIYLMGACYIIKWNERKLPCNCITIEIQLLKLSYKGHWVGVQLTNVSGCWKCKIPTYFNLNQGTTRMAKHWNWHILSFCTLLLQILKKFGLDSNLFLFVNMRLSSVSTNKGFASFLEGGKWHWEGNNIEKANILPLSHHPNRR